MTADAPEEAATLLPDVPELPLTFEFTVTVPDEDWDQFLPRPPSGGAVSGETVMRVPLKAKTLSEAMILGASLGAWTKVPGARCEIGPARAPSR
jgi:hypothetical protein